MAKTAENVRRAPIGITPMTADRATTTCRCGKVYVPEIVRLQGATRIITRVRPCPGCGQPKEPKYSQRIRYQIRDVKPVTQYESVLDVPVVPYRRTK